MKTVGIYSYPKSGNTWIRHIVAHATGITPADIPGLHGNGKMADSKSVNGQRFYKSHSKNYVPQNSGKKLETNAVIHIRRNPLDVFLSYLNYISGNLRASAAIPFDSVDAISGTDLFDLYLDTFICLGQIENFPQSGSWYEHNKKWLERSASEPVLCLKYEEILDDPVNSLSGLDHFLGLKNGSIEHGISLSEKTTKKNGRFFWKQQAGNFRQYMSQEQIDRFLMYRGSDCAKLGYSESFFRGTE